MLGLGAVRCWEQGSTAPAGNCGFASGQVSSSPMEKADISLHFHCLIAIIREQS